MPLHVTAMARDLIVMLIVARNAPRIVDRQDEEDRRVVMAQRTVEALSRFNLDKLREAREQHLLRLAEKKKRARQQQRRRRLKERSESAEQLREKESLRGEVGDLQILHRSSSSSIPPDSQSSSTNTFHETVSFRSIGCSGGGVDLGRFLAEPDGSAAPAGVLGSDGGLRRRIIWTNDQ